MLRRLTAHGIELLARSLEPVDLQSREAQWLEAQCSQLVADPPAASDVQAWDDLRAARAALRGTAFSGLPLPLPPGGESAGPSSVDGDKAIALAREWQSAWRVAGVLSRGVVAAGAGRMLDTLSAFGNDDERHFASAALEKLLLHVEVHRTRCLAVIEPPPSTEHVWLERHDVAILFSRTAYRRRDLRMLNAAFKLNDWALSAYERGTSRVPRPRRLRYLLSLAEAERAAAELLAC